MDFKKPLYKLRIKASGSPYDVRINDCPILSDDEGYPITTEIPINHWLVNGINKIKIILTRPDEGIGVCELKLNASEYGNQSSQSNIIMSYKCEAPSIADIPEEMHEKNDDEVQEPIDPEVVLEEDIELDVPFPPWQWNSVEPIELDDKGRTELTHHVKKLWQALKDKNLDLVAEMMDLKARENAVAYYQTEKESIENLRTHYENYFKNSELTLDELYESELEFRTFADGRLFLVLDSATKLSPILYFDKNDIATYLNIMIFRNSEGEWQIIR
jgi:hypothetical protein